MSACASVKTSSRWESKLRLVVLPALPLPETAIRAGSDVLRWLLVILEVALSVVLIAPFVLWGIFNT
jgi:hypothetical protein